MTLLGKKNVHDSEILPMTLHDLCTVFDRKVFMYDMQCYEVARRKRHGGLQELMFYYRGTSSKATDWMWQQDVKHSANVAALDSEVIQWRPSAIVITTKQSTSSMKPVVVNDQKQPCRICRSHWSVCLYSLEILCYVGRGALYYADQTEAIASGTLQALLTRHCGVRVINFIVDNPKWGSQTVCNRLKRWSRVEQTHSRGYS